jgi:hypothetical protein
MENLRFYDAVRKFEKPSQTPDEAIRQEAMHIANAYVRSGSPQVGILCFFSSVC